MWFNSMTELTIKKSIKFSFSEKATKMCAIVLMVLKFAYVKTMRTIAQIFVAFSDKLNFMYIVMTEVV